MGDGSGHQIYDSGRLPAGIEYQQQEMALQGAVRRVAVSKIGYRHPHERRGVGRRGITGRISA
jgi:hypothetical protein